MRLAGVYALAGLADDWTDQQQTCIDVLCAYLRMPYDPDPLAPSYRQGEKEVRHTIIRVIGEHLRADAPVSWCGRNLDFTGATFDGGELAGARFTGGDVLFRRAEFVAGSVYIDDAEFVGGRITFFRANFTGGNLFFGGSKFQGSAVYLSETKIAAGMVSFRRTSLTGGSLSFDLAELNGGKIFFGGAELAGCAVSFSDALFNGGEVDLSEVAAYDVPPVFDPWTIPPSGLLLPVAPPSPPL